jgi:lactate permease
MGFNPLLSVAAVLLFDGIFAAFGAVGTPLIAGLKTPLGLTDKETADTAVYSAWMLTATSFMLMGFKFHIYKQLQGDLQEKKQVLLLLLMAVVPMIIFAYLVPEYSSILAAVSMLLLSVVFFMKRKTNVNFKAWFPYLVLVALLLLPKLIAPLNTC